MASREALRDEAILFGANTMYDLLEALAARPLEPFHGADVAHRTGRTRTQIQRELMKLKRLDLLQPHATVGRAELLTLVDDRLGSLLLELPGLLRARVAEARLRRQT